MSIILSLDLSTRCTGWSIFSDTKLVQSGAISASSSDVVERIKKITKGIETVLEQYPNVDKVILEEVRPENDQYGVGNLHTHKVLMWLQSSIIFMLHDNYSKAEVVYTYPSEWRKACGIRTGRGIKREALKAADIKFVKDNYGLTVGDDEADAIGIGHAYVNQLDNEINWE